MSENKDWTGNFASGRALVCVGKDHTTNNREEHDYYATDPKALELLLDLEPINKNVWECACGEGHLAKVFENHGFNVKATDLIDRGYGVGGIDFLKCDERFDGDIVTNPPYRYAREFVEHALDLIGNGNKVIMFLKITWLEGKERRKLFEKFPPKTIYVASGRLHCGKNGVFVKNNIACYAWYVWEKGFNGEPVVRWFN